MLHIRALKQCARQVIHGIPFDEDERHIAEINVTPGAEAEQKAPERPKVSRRGGAAAAAASEPVAESHADGGPSTAGATTKPTATKSNAAPTVDAELVDEAPRGETEAEIEHRQQQERKAQRQAESEAAAKKAAAEAEAKKKAEAEAAKKTEPEKIDTSKVPEVIPGVGIDGFMGKSYPVTLSGTIKTLTPKASGSTPYIEMTVECPQGTIPVVVFNTTGASDVVKKREDGTFDIMNTAIRMDGFIEFNLTAKLRPKTIEKDGKKEKVADTTKAPALIASEIKDAEESVI